MTVHPSLSSKGKGKRKRSVLKRYERIKEMLEKEKWKPGDTVFGLPKLKVLRWKAKKAKKEAPAEEQAAAETTQAAGAASAPAAKKETPAAKKSSSKER